MPINSDAKYRYDIIDTCLRNTKRRWTRKDLHNAVMRKLELKEGPDAKISENQIYHDLQAMQFHFNAPIDVDKTGRAHIYYYTIAGYSINNIPVNEKELDALGEASLMTKHQRGFSTSKALEEIYRKLENKYGGSDLPRPVISFQKAPDFKGQQHQEPLLSFIRQNKAVMITHQSFNSAEPRDWLIHPYLLKEDDHRWYVFGYVPEKQNFGVFGLERILNIRPSDEPYIESTLENNEDYFRHVLGVTVLADEEVQDIGMVFSPKMANYIRTRSLHHSQQCGKPLADGSLPVNYKLKINPELVSRILSYGPDVTVLKPQRLKDEIITAAKNLIANYD
jgi:predicted DNA-binding transcriptional regulator YafY